MNNNLFKIFSNKTLKSRLTFAVAMIMIFSNTASIFAFTTPNNHTFNGNNFVYRISFDGEHEVKGTDAQGSPKQLDPNMLTADYQSVPLDTTFTFTFNTGKVFLFGGSYDDDTNTFSKTKTNRDLIYIKDANGNKVDAEVSNKLDPIQTYQTSVFDGTVQVHPKTPLDYDTNYFLVAEKYVTQINRQGSLMDVTGEDIVIPFKTEVRQKPTLTKAELRGASLRLEGLPKDENLVYNFAVDGQFDDANWKAFSYTDDTADIEVQNMNLTSSSKIIVGYAAQDHSAPTLVSDPISVFYVSGSAPSLIGAVLNGQQLTLNGLPKSASNLECRIAEDGQNYGEWQNLTVTGSTAVVDVSGLNLVQGKSMIQVRYKASAPWSASESAEKSFDYGVGVKSPLTVGRDTLLTDGIKVTPVSLNTPAEGEENTVTIRYAEGEKLATTKPNMGFFEGVDALLFRTGGIYGFNLKGAGDGTNNHVKVTIPFTLPADHPADMPDDQVNDSSKVGIYMLAEVDFDHPDKTWQHWKYVPTTIDEVNHTATIDVTNFNANGKDLILTVRYDGMEPARPHIAFYTRTDDSLTFQVGASDISGTKEVIIKRVNRADPNDVKTFILTNEEYPRLSEFRYGNWILWTDNDPKHGVHYDYIAVSATDVIGNTAADLPYPDFATATLDSAADLVKQTQEAFYKNLEQVQSAPYNNPRIRFAEGDSQNLVTKEIRLPTFGIIHLGANSIEWTSDRPDITKKIYENGLTGITRPVGQDVKVTLTGKITYRILKPQSSGEDETATGTITTSIIVKGIPEDKPQFKSIGNKTVEEGKVLSFPISAVHPYGKILTYSAANLPKGAAFDTKTKTFKWTPNYTQAGTYKVKFTVNDGTQSVTQEVSITVKDVNRAPVFATIGSKSVNEGKTLTFTVKGLDADGNKLTYSASGLPKGASFDTKTRTFKWTPGYTQAGTYKVKFIVKDGKAVVSKVVTIVVKNVNRTPKITPIANKTIKEGQKLSFTVKALDADGDKLTYSATGLPRGAKFDSKKKAFTWTPGYTQAGTYKVKFVVKDGKAAASKVVTIVVKNANKQFSWLKIRSNIVSYSRYNEFSKSVMSKVMSFVLKM